MEIIYIVNELCEDNGVVYTEDLGVCFKTYSSAKKHLNNLITNEYDSLIVDDEKYYIIDYIEDDREACEREIWYRDDNTDERITRYYISKLKVVE